MKQMKFLKFAAAMLCCVFAMTIVSCDKDDDDAPTPSAFKFNPAKVEVAVGASANVTVSGGTEPYTVASSDVKTATVKVSKNIITVTGVKEGKVTLNVSDKNKKVGMLAVTVKKVTALELDKKAVNVAVGKRRDRYGKKRNSSLLGYGKRRFHRYSKRKGWQNYGQRCESRYNHDYCDR